MTLLAIVHRVTSRKDDQMRDFERALVDRIVAACLEQSSVFVPRWLGVTMNNLAKLGVFNELLVSRFLDQGMKLVEEFELQSLSNTLNAMLKFNIHNEPFVTRLTEVAISKLDTPDPLAVCSTIHALGRLRVDESALRRFVVAAGAGNFDFPPRELIDIIGSVAKYDFYNACKGFLEQIDKKLPSFSVRQLTILLNILAKWGVPPSEMAKYFEAAVGRLHDAEAHQVADLMNGLVRFDIYDEVLMKKLCGEALKKATSFSPAEICNFLKALVKFGVYDEELVMQLCLVAMDKVSEFSATDISFTLHALAQFGVFDEALVQKICEVALDKAETFSAQELGTTINALAKFAIFNEALVTRFCEVGLTLTDLISQDVAVFLGALAKCDFYHEALIKHLIAESKKIPKYKIRHIALTLNALASFDVYDKELYDKLCDLVRARTDELVLTDVALMLYSLVCAQHFDFGLYKEFLAVMQKFPESSATSESLGTISYIST